LPTATPPPPSPSGATSTSGARAARVCTWAPERTPRSMAIPTRCPAWSVPWRFTWATTTWLSTPPTPPSMWPATRIPA